MSLQQEWEGREEEMTDGEEDRLHCGLQQYGANIKTVLPFPPWNLNYLQFNE